VHGHCNRPEFDSNGSRLDRAPALFTAVLRTIPSAPETLPLLGLVALGAGWATQVGTLPRRLPPFDGPAGVGLAWACLYAVLALLYGSAEAVAGDRASIRRVLRRVGICVLLALISTQLLKLMATGLVTPWTWDQLFYLKRLVPPASLGFWCVILLPRETRALFQRVRRNPGIAPLPDLALLLAAAAFLVSLADLGFEWSGGSAAGVTLKSEIIYREAWLANALILFAAHALVLVVTRRLGFALLLVSPLYAVFAMATLAKVRYMHSSVQPLDLLRLRELLPFLRTFFGDGPLVLVAAGLVLWAAGLIAARRLTPSPMSPVRRWSIGLVSLVMLLAFPVAYFRASSVPDDVEYSSFTSADALLSRFRARGREFKEMARLRGTLLSFIAELPAAFVRVPPGYSADSVASVLSRYCRRGAGMPPPQGGVNLIIYMIESFMDPDDLRVRFTSDPIPNIRALSRSHIGGHAVVPEEFGGSANTEFEALTGMATSFLPGGSVAYRQYLSRPIPSLPSTLRGLGYTTSAVQADPKHFYSRERAYRLLGFDRVVWLGDDPDVERDPRGWWPTDRAVVDAVIEASRHHRPFFVFAFPSSTHFPYVLGSYAGSDLDVLEEPSKAAAAELKEYINTLREADREVGRLIEHFQHRSDSTIIAVLGDHLPPLPEGALQPFFSSLANLQLSEQARMRRRVPLLVWANFQLQREEPELSVNALPSYLLEKMGIPAPGFLAVPDAVRRRAPVLAGYVRSGDGRVWHRDSLPHEVRRLIDDYRLLQYDLLLGNGYALRTPQGQGCGGLIHPAQASGER
jgi:Sulfatase